MYVAYFFKVNRILEKKKKTTNSFRNFLMQYIKLIPEKGWLTCKFSSSRILWINYLLFMLLCRVQYKKLFYWVT